MCPSSVCYNKILHKLFLTILEAGSLRLGYQNGWILVRALLQVADCQLRVSLHGAESREREETSSLLSILVGALMPS